MLSFLDREIKCNSRRNVERDEKEENKTSLQQPRVVSEVVTEQGGLNEEEEELFLAMERDFLSSCSK